MEQETTWKAHSLTLFVFAGIVVLCSIFFILGMLVGRAQTQKIDSTALKAPDLKVAKAAPKEDKPELTFYDAVKKGEPEPPPAPEPSSKVDPPAQAQPDVTS